MATPQVYVVRIYSATPDGSLLGVVEDVERGSRERFTCAAELWGILTELYGSHCTPSARDAEI